MHQLQKQAVTLIAVTMSSLAVTTVIPATAEQQQQKRPEYRGEVIAPQHESFGFRLGEERRYVRGPERILRVGEFELWTIRLDEISNADTGMPLYTFIYSRELSLINPNDRDYMDSLRATMSVTVNHYGFPVEVRYGGSPEEESDTDSVSYTQNP